MEKSPSGLECGSGHPAAASFSSPGAQLSLAPPRVLRPATGSVSAVFGLLPVLSAYRGALAFPCGIPGREVLPLQPELPEDLGGHGHLPAPARDSHGGLLATSG